MAEPLWPLDVLWSAVDAEWGPEHIQQLAKFPLGPSTKPKTGFCALWLQFHAMIER